MVKLLDYVNLFHTSKLIKPYLLNKTPHLQTKQPKPQTIQHPQPPSPVETKGGGSITSFLLSCYPR